MVKNNVSINLVGVEWSTAVSLKKPPKSVSDTGNPYHVACLHLLCERQRGQLIHSTNTELSHRDLTRSLFSGDLVARMLNWSHETGRWLH